VAHYQFFARQEVIHYLLVVQVQRVETYTVPLLKVNSLAVECV